MAGGLRAQFRSAVPRARESSGLRYVAREMARRIEKAPQVVEPVQDTYANPGRGASGESSN